MKELSILELMQQGGWIMLVLAVLSVIAVDTSPSALPNATTRSLWTESAIT